MRLVRRAAGAAGRACRRSARLGRRARLNGEATRARGGAHARARTPRRPHPRAGSARGARDRSTGAGPRTAATSGDPPRTGHRWERSETADGYGASARRSSPTARPSTSVVFPRRAVVADTDVTRRGSVQDPCYRRTRHIWSPRSRSRAPPPAAQRRRCGLCRVRRPPPPDASRSSSRPIANVSASSSGSPATVVPMARKAAPATTATSASSRAARQPVGRSRACGTITTGHGE
jgi:hypothetical protein